jgi:predicted RNA-binding Zn-ribbon protein involved in translation (DUF1610 family)
MSTDDIGSTFTCYNCGEQSKYQNRFTSLLMEMKTIDARPETRTYKCTECGKPNQITMTPFEWSMIIHASS